jgi:ABC-type amino acid transport system permease subunit
VIQRTEQGRWRAQNAGMETQTTLFVACVLFGVAASGGIVMALIRLGRKSNPPHWIAMLHGFLAAAGVTLLAYVTIFAQVPDLAQLALLAVLLAAAGGAWMNLGRHQKGELIPVGVMVGHALMAVAGVALLLLAL